MFHLLKNIYVTSDKLINMSYDRIVISQENGVDVLDYLKINRAKLYSYGRTFEDVIGEGKQYSTAIEMFDFLTTVVKSTKKRFVIYCDDLSFTKIMSSWYKIIFANPDKTSCKVLLDNCVYRYLTFYKGRYSRDNGNGNGDSKYTFNIDNFENDFDQTTVNVDSRNSFIEKHKAELSVEFLLATYFAGHQDLKNELKETIKILMKKDLEKYFYELKEIFWVHMYTDRFTKHLGLNKTYNWTNYRDIENDNSRFARLMLNERIWKSKYMDMPTTGKNINIEKITEQDIKDFEDYTVIAGKHWIEEDAYLHLKSDINKMYFLKVYKDNGFTDEILEKLLEMEATFENASGAFFSLDLETVNHWLIQTLISNRNDTEFCNKYSIL
jgi:hypothetical protein